eukprot:scaffold11294_cov117-Isochrysis_galbana.AAC.5
MLAEPQRHLPLRRARGREPGPHRSRTREGHSQEESARGAERPKPRNRAAVDARASASRRPPWPGAARLLPTAAPP